MSTEPGRLRSVATGGDHPDLIAADAARTHYAAAATPAATTRAYSEAWEAFHTWCGTVDLVSLPADPVTVERYIALGAVRKDLAASTLAVWIAAIADRHHDAGHPDPTTGEKVREVLAGVRTTQTLAGREIDQAPAADHPVVTAMITTAHTTAATWPEQVAARRDIAMILTGFSMLGRRSEIAALTASDLSDTTGGGERLLSIRRRGSKANREKITRVYRRAGSGPALYCLWCGLHRWLVVLDARDRAADREVRRQKRHRHTTIDQAAVNRAVSLAVQRALIIDDADPHTHRCAQAWPELADPHTPLFRPLAKAGPPLDRAISDRQIARIIKTRGAAAGRPDLRGHSLRAGGATEAFERGALLTDVMALGGWRSAASALRYDRNGEQRSARVDLGI
ncbi:hypothetical protein [Nocardia alba]|uniref:Tyr recombinase domain-containing protein n=1 Tax=Nocardia alba TaxID=225051 RepID=A0A4R1FBA9_9NOCA|nr:hypothetical protein [Nocardia alba]TCJ90009.1 hypothetical protein DFR71_6302 [Nocardia alba]